MKKILSALSSSPLEDERNMQSETLTDDVTSVVSISTRVKPSFIQVVKNKLNHKVSHTRAHTHTHAFAFASI